MILHTKSIARILGHLMTITGLAMTVPLILAALGGNPQIITGFLVPAAFSLALGGALSVVYRDADRSITMKDGMILTVLAWFLISCFGAMPYLLTGVTHSPISALFESISSYTTTGATILTNVSGLPRSILFWRSFSQWLGGIGILVLLHSLIPASFEQQSSILSTETEAINTDNISFSRRSTAKLIYLFYIAMSGAQVLLLKFCGLNWYDSFIFSFGTSASGGLNNYSDGLLHLANPAAEAVLALFMLLSCVNFALYVRLLRGDTDKVHGNTELNAYCGIAVAGVILVTLDLFVHHVYTDLAESLRFGVFQDISFLTTSGLSSADFNAWPSFSKMVLTILSFIGGCSSSTGGALKVIRIVILSKMIWRSFTTRIHPNAVVTIKTNGKPVPSNIANKAVAYTLIFFVLFLSGTFLLTFDAAADFQSAFTASGAMLCNIGTGAGVMGMFAEYHMFGQFSQLVMCFLMLAGRLEIYAVLLPFSRSFWREKI